MSDGYILAAKWMSALAMRLRSLLGRSGLYSRRRIIYAKFISVKQGHFQRPSARDALCDYVRAHASLSRPILCDHANAHERDPYVRAAIAVLLGAWNPAAILRRVIAVIVPAVETVSGRARSHVSAEVPVSHTGRRFLPALAYLDSAPTVAVKVRRGGHIAPSQHVFVQGVRRCAAFRRFAHAV